MMIFSVFTATDTSNFAMVDYSISFNFRNVVSAMRGENPFGIGIGTFWGNFWDFRGFVKFFGLLWDYFGFLSLQIFSGWILDLRDFHRIFGILRFFWEESFGIFGIS